MRPLRNFVRPAGVASYGLGVVAGVTGLAAGFVAAAAGFVVPAAGFGGAGTPDCTL